MKSSTLLLTLSVVLALLGLGAWLLFGKPGESTPPEGEAAHRPGDPALAPPVLRGRDGEPVRKPEPEPVVPDVPARGLVLDVRVLDDAGGRALEGAQVLVIQGDGDLRTLGTNDTGLAKIHDLRTGEIHVVARAPGFVRAETQLELAGAEPEVLELRLARGALLEGTVVDARTGLAIVDASVVVAPGGSLDGWTVMSAESPFGDARTDERGRFVLAEVPPGVLVTARATATGYGVASKSMKLAPAPDTSATVVLQLSPAAVLAGSVVRKGGDPAAGARVYAVPADAPEMLLADPETRCTSNGRLFRSLRGVADDDGTFGIDGLELGAMYIVFAELEGLGRSALAHGVVATDENPRPRLDLVLLGAASLTVRVWNPEGEPLEEGRLTLFGDGFPLKLELQSPGVFAVREPPPGSYTLRATCAGTVVQEFPVEIRAAEQKEMEVRLERGLVLAGVLVDDAGRPIPGQKIFVDRPWQEAGEHRPSQGTASTDEEGRFRIAGLRDGPHTLGLVLGRHVVPDDLRLTPPDEDLRLVVLRKAGLSARIQLPPGFAPPDGVGIRVGREEDGGYAESGHGLPWNQGELRFEDLSPGEARVRIQVAGLLEVVRKLTLKPGEVADLGTVAMEKGLELEGRVVDREDRPIPGARVTAGEIWTAMHRAVVTSEDGRFLLPTLVRGTNEIQINAAGFLPRTVKVILPEEASGRSYVLDRGCLVTVRVSDADGQPAPARRVRWRATAAPGEAESEDSEETDAKGLLEVRLRDGAWTFEVLDDEWNPVLATETRLTEAGTATVELPLPR